MLRKVCASLTNNIPDDALDSFKHHDFSNHGVGDREGYIP